MEIEKLARILIYLHAGLGGLALLAGAIALIVKKGAYYHRLSGKVFFYSMLVSAILALVIALFPNHENPFLFSIGVFSSYFLITGYRSLNFKRKDPNLTWDRIIAYLIILTGIVMVSYPILLYGNVNIVLLVFGIVGIVFGIRDIRIQGDPDLLRKSWMKIHLGKMTGGYIAAVTAFLVVNAVLPGIWNWFTPGIVGGFFIAYWMRKLGSTKAKA